MPYHQVFNSLLLSIEGEPGYDAEIYQRNVDAYTNFLTCGVHKSGATVEGLGKNQLNGECVIPLKKPQIYTLFALYKPVDTSTCAATLLLSTRGLVVDGTYTEQLGRL